MNSPSRIVSVVGWLTVIGILVCVIFGLVPANGRTGWLTGLIAVISLFSSIAVRVSTIEAKNAVDELTRRTLR